MRESKFARVMRSINNRRVNHRVTYHEISENPLNDAALSRRINWSRITRKFLTFSYTHSYERYHTQMAANCPNEIYRAVNF